MISTADISPCGLYRYALTRTWDLALPVLVFIMLNPSTADWQLDDPTIRRCMGFARDNGFGGIVVVNLFAFRATDPKLMKSAAAPVGADNEAAILDAARRRRPGDVFVAAWGVHGRLNERDRAVVALLEGEGVEVQCLGRTKDGHPRHPLYLPATAPLTPLRAS